MPESHWGRARGRRNRRWTLATDADGCTLTLAGSVTRFAGDDLVRLAVRPGWPRWSLRVAGRTPVRLSGLRRMDGEALQQVLALAVAQHRIRPVVVAALAWQARAEALVTNARRVGRWIPQQDVDDLEQARPVLADLDIPDRGELLASLSAGERAALAFAAADLVPWIASHNEQILAAERHRHRHFFDTVESKPLTHEQIRAVVCFDNRVRVIASAGSGKTSVMVARAAYAILRGFVVPERVLLLAFNRDAAVELQERVKARLTALGLPSEGIQASTFHAFGLRVLAEETGKKPRPAPWLEAGQDVETICRIVDELRDGSPDFAYRWDLFRLLYARASDTPDGGDPDGYDSRTRSTGFRTANGEVVKSEGERIIADWLFYNGVDYSYEKPYVVDVADAGHSQYRPDFFYPSIDVWHEHWALGHDGKPPASLDGYAESMRWKQALHRQHGTTLIETTWAAVIDRSGLRQLGKTLTDLGLELDWNPDRPGVSNKPLRHEDLARLIRTFMAHVKSNALTREQLDQRVSRLSSHGAQVRSRLFLDFYWDIHDQWQARLAAEGCVDFEDMLVEAAACLEDSQFQTPYDLVLVDEFQDASQARARVTRALVSGRDRYLLAVGDDWQAINRFAGADLSIMTNFAQWFGPGPTLQLQTTFRCPQTICDVAGSFVSSNPNQLHKQVASARGPGGAQVRIVRVATREAIPHAVAEELARIKATGSAELPSGRADRIPTVQVLGRYRFDQALMPAQLPVELDVRFRTVHGAKGLEADYVILPNLTTGTYGFPSTIADDPVLALAMTEPDAYPHAEERRLLYVALTRARKEVTLLAVEGLESPFVLELMKHPDVVVLDSAGRGSAVRVCPSCGQGSLVARKGPYGEFLGCSTFPRCRHTQRVDLPTVSRPGSSTRQ